MGEEEVEVGRGRQRQPVWTLPRATSDNTLVTF